MRPENYSHIMNKIKQVLLFALLAFPLVYVSAQKDKKTEMQNIDVLNIGSLAYPSAIEERSDIPFRLLVDEQYRKLLGDTIDYEKFRPALIFFEKGFKAPAEGQKKMTFGYITVTVMTGQYRFPKVLSDVQKKKLEQSIRHDVDTNLVGTDFKVTKWNYFDFVRINGLFAMQYSYQQELKKKDPIVTAVTTMYDSDVQLQITLSAPKKEYNKWLLYYNTMVQSFVRSVNIADIATLRYPTTIAERKDIPFKYLVDKEFKRILGDSTDYEKFRPGLLFLDRDFEIGDSTDVAPFGSLSLNVIPEFNKRVLNKDSLNLRILEQNIKAGVQVNIDSTAYKISRWGDFYLTETKGLPTLIYSYTQRKAEGEPSDIYSACIFDKTLQIQLTASAPESQSAEWKSHFEDILSSYHRLQPVAGRGTVIYPLELEERSDIPFVKLVDAESKKKLGDSINYEQFRPACLFLKKDFNENDSLQLADFGSITISDRTGDFARLSHPDSISTDSIELNMRASVERNLSNTRYNLVSWDSFDAKSKNGCRYITYSYTQQIEGSEPKRIVCTNIYTNTSQTQVILTASDSEFLFWKPQYDVLTDSFRLQGWR